MILEVSDFAKLRGAVQAAKTMKGFLAIAKRKSKSKIDLPGWRNWEMRLRKEGVSQIRRPCDIVCQPVDHIGERTHSWDARVPVLFFRRVRQGLLLQIRVLLHPLLKLMISSGQVDATRV
jgi:hypothetical protein